MKPVLITSVIALIFASALLLTVQRESRQQQQLADYERHVQDLLSDVEAGSRRRLELENQLEAVRSECNTLNSQLTSVNDQLEKVEQQANPDYQLMESDIRRQLSYEFLQQERQLDPINPRVNLLQQLSNLDPLELGEVMSVHGQFGNFLRALDADDQRMEVIVNALTDLVAEQNQARQELVMEMREGAVGRRALRSGMQEIMNPQAQIERLSQTLTEDELLTYQQVLTTQQNQQNAVVDFTVNRSTDTGAIFFGGDGRSGAIAIPPQPALPINPRN